LPADSNGSFDGETTLLTSPWKVQLPVNGSAPSGLQDSYGRMIGGEHNVTAGGHSGGIIYKMCCAERV